MSKTTDRRKKLITLIHVARNELGMDEESYRQMLANIPELEGATSTSKLAVPKLELVLEQLKNKGFKVVPKNKNVTAKPAAKMADDPQSRLIRHLWLRLHTAGVVRDGSEQALAKFVANCTRVEALQWLSSDQASQVIERLKQWAKRAGVKV